MKHEEIQSLKIALGRRPFDDRASFDSAGFTACPFHSGDSSKSFHLYQKDGVWLGKCFSTCATNGGKAMDAIAFVQKKDGLSFPDALAKLSGEAPASTPVPTGNKQKPKKMTSKEWGKWGREVTAADIKRLAAQRKDNTASVEVFRSLGCRVKGDYIGFPLRRTIYDDESGQPTGVEFYTVHMRHLDEKDFVQENSISQNGFFNLDTVNPMEDVYVVEGEPDVAIMEQAGFRTVSVNAGNQQKFDFAALERIGTAARIFLMGDQRTKANSEDPGQACMDRLQAVLPPSKTYRIRFNDAKDACEVARKYGDAFAGRIAELSEDSLQSWVSKTVPAIHQLPDTPQRWIINRMFPESCLTLLAGKQGAQKSLFALLAAQSIASGRDFLGRHFGAPYRLNDVREDDIVLEANTMPPLPVLYIDRENPAGVVNERRHKLGIIGNRQLQYWGPWFEQTPEEPDDPRLLEFAYRHHGFIIFDSLQQWYGEDSEIDNTAMVRLMNKFQRLARAGAGVLVLHHDAKYGESGYRGATSIVGVPDMSIRANKTAEGLIELSAIRFRLCSDWQLDWRVHFNAPPHTYEVEVVRDLTLAQAVREKVANAQNESDADELDAILTKDPRLEKVQIEAINKTKFGRNRQERLAALRGWTYDRKNKWSKATPATIAPVQQPLDSSTY